MKNARIIFMGTPDFAVASLKKLVENDFNIIGVITAPDKPAGRGKKIQMSAVKEYALEKGLNILQPTNLKAVDFIEKLKNLKPDLQIVVAFRMLPEIVWSLPPLGTFNLHASLLPQYRGAAPINHAIINGEKITGVTTFFLNKEIDKGAIIDKKEVEILAEDNAGSLHDKLMEVGSDLLIETTKNILSNNFELVEQEKIIENDENLKEAPKIFKEFCEINWHDEMEKIQNFIRGLSPYPGAYTNIQNGKDEEIFFKILKTEKEILRHDFPIGNIITNNKNMIKVSVKEGFINILELQMMGKRRMNTKEFLNGFNFFSNNSLFIIKN